MADFLSGLVEKVEGALGGSLSGALQQQLQNLLQPATLQTILSKADEAGLGDKVRSWIGHGDNLPATPDEIRDILGSSTVHDLVARTGLPADTVLTAVAHFLPTAVDKTTPAGELPAQPANKEA